jgi:hypothetical protein
MELWSRNPQITISMYSVVLSQIVLIRISKNYSRIETGGLYRRFWET